MSRVTVGRIALLALVSSVVGSFASRAAPPAGRSWSAPLQTWQITPFGAELYGFGTRQNSYGFCWLKVFDGLNGTVAGELSFATPPTAPYVSFGESFFVTADGDVIVRRQTMYAVASLLRYNMATKQVVWNLTTGGLDEVILWAASGEYVYVTGETQLRVVSVANGTFVPFSSAAIPKPSGYGMPALITATGWAGWLAIFDGAAVQGYSLVDPAHPKLMWTATNASTGVNLTFDNPPIVSLDGQWLLGIADANTPTYYGNPGSVFVIVDTTTGAASRGRVFAEQEPTLWGASGSLAVMTIPVQSGQQVVAQYGTFNLTSMEFVQSTSLSVIGNAQCGLATDGSAFVCATQADVSNPGYEIGFTVFDATTSGAVTAQYPPVANQNLADVSVQSQQTPLTVVPSADGLWYNVYFPSNLLGMTQVPRPSA